MSELPISSPYRSTPDAPVSDAEREQLSSRLNAAFTAGSLEQDDYQQRLDQLFAAHRLGDLVPVAQGLPPLQTYDAPAIVGSGGGNPGELTQAKNGGGLTVVAVGGIAAAVLLIIILLLVIL